MLNVSKTSNSYIPLKKRNKNNRQDFLKRFKDINMEWVDKTSDLFTHKKKVTQS